MGEDKTPKNAFLYHYEWAEILLKFPDALRLKIDDAIKKYALYGEEPTDPEIAYSVFTLIKDRLDKDRKKYNETCKKNAENVKKRWERYRQKQSNTTVYDRIQSNTNYTDNDNEYDNNNDINNLESNKLDSLSTLQVDPSEPKIEKSSKKSEIDYVALGNYFNSTLEKEHSTISRVQRITDRRKGYIESRCREYGKESIMKVIQLAAKSDFLNGKNNRNWKADFDWIFLPNNFPKILEGNYNNQNNGNDTQHTQSSGSGTPSNGIPFKGKIIPGCGLIED